MATTLPIFQPTPIFKDRTDYRQVLIREMDAGKIPLSLGRDCPVKCEFCYELDHSYRETLDPPKTSDEDWKFILEYISRKPTDPKVDGDDANLKVGTRTNKPNICYI